MGNYLTAPGCRTLCLLLEAALRGFLCTQALPLAAALTTPTNQTPPVPFSFLSILIWSNSCYLWWRLKPERRQHVLLSLGLLTYAGLSQAHLIAVLELGRPLILSDVTTNAGVFWSSYVVQYGATHWQAPLAAAVAWRLLLSKPLTPQPPDTTPQIKTAAFLWASALVALPIAHQHNQNTDKPLAAVNLEQASLDLTANLLNYGVNQITGRRTPPTLHNRSAAPKTETPTFDVLIILQESWSLWANAATSNLTPNLTNLFKERRAHTTPLNRLFAASTATSLTLPSLFTGVHLLAPEGELFKRPLVWQQAKAAGMTAAWISSSPWRSSILHKVLAPRPQHLIAGEHLPGGPVNESARDDLEAAFKARDWIHARNPQERLFLIFYTNAMHTPCQDRSRHWPSLNETSACRAGARIADHAVGIVLNAFRQTKRLDNTLIVATGDHGEHERPFYVDPKDMDFNEWRHAMSRQGAWRLSSSRDVYLRTPAWISLPTSLPNRTTAYHTLRQWRRQPVSTPDLGSTLFDLLGNPLPNQPDYGLSLLKPPPETPRRLLTLNTPDHIDPKSNWVTFGFIEQDQRFLYNDLDGFRLYDLTTDPEQNVNLLCNASNAVHAYWKDALQSVPRLYSLAANGPHQRHLAQDFACDAQTTPTDNPKQPAPTTRRHI